MSDRRYRWLLRFFPAAFREEHERELLRVWREERQDAAVSGTTGVWRRALTDTLRVGPREYVSAWAHNLRMAARTLARTPAFTLSAVLTLALGTGATAAIFSLVNGVLLRPLPWLAPERIALVWAIAPPGNRTWLSSPEVEEMAREIPAFQSVAGFTDLKMAHAAPGSAQELQVLGVSHEFFPLLGVRPLFGRVFDVTDDAPTSARSVMLSEHVWRTRFGAAAHVIGDTTILDDQPYTIIGVVPASFEWLPASSVIPEHVDAWVAIEPHLATRDRSVRMIHAVARLTDDASFATATAQLRSYAQRVTPQFASAYANGEWTFEAVSFVGHVLQPARTPLLVVLALVTLVLLMACANVANLLLARAARRRTEIAVRTALGAGPARLAGELLAEASLLALAGTVLGLAFALAVPPIVRAADPSALPRLEGVGIDWRVGAMMLALLGTAVAICTLVPLIERSQVRTAPGQIGDRSGAPMPAALRVGRLLVIAQTALAAAIVIATIFVGDTFARLHRVDLGFDHDNVLTARTTRFAGGSPAEWTPFFEAAVAQLRQQPGVIAAGAVSALPLSGAMLGSTFLVGPVTEPQRIDADLRGVSGDYLAATGIRVLSGRTFTPADRSNSPPVAIVDEVFARSISPDENVVGRRVRWGRQPKAEIEIVGVVAAVRHRGPGEPARATVYRPITQYPRNSMYLVVRTAAPADTFVPILHSAIAAIDPAQPLADVATLRSRVERSMTRTQTSLYLAGTLALLAVIMAVVGVYGVLAIAVAQRTREFGVRQALGATPNSLRGTILRDGMLLTAIGLALGIGLAWAVVRAGRAMLHGVDYTNTSPYLLGSLMVMALALLAFSIPAWRAGRISPLVALRQ